ncbi:MAG: class I SAM-dependent methyltransferase [Actinomycetota bacterium]|nr:class I SAM-dependent methyltransferase [Actinomycetota bacterium]
MLEEARRLGFLGPGPVEAHLRHAAGFAAAIRTEWPGALELRSAVDLGSGGGVPALALAFEFPETEWLLVEVAVRRAAFLRTAVDLLGLPGGITVVEIRAEELGRRAEHRAAHQLVVARGFGPPAVTAECAAPLLVVSGRAVVSDPPGGAVGRWPVDGLSLLGMTPVAAVHAEGSTYQVLVQETECPSRYPRRVGVPAKRPLFWGGPAMGA